MLYGLTQVKGLAEYRGSGDPQHGTNRLMPAVPYPPQHWPADLPRQRQRHDEERNPPRSTKHHGNITTFCNHPFCIVPGARQDSLPGCTKMRHRSGSRQDNAAQVENRRKEGRTEGVVCFRAKTARLAKVRIATEKAPRGRAGVLRHAGSPAHSIPCPYVRESGQETNHPLLRRHRHGELLQLGDLRGLHSRLERIPGHRDEPWRAGLSCFGQCDQR